MLVVNANFGCGSSREHAPQGLVRYGIRAIIGESFSEIFLGNSAMLGLPCFTADHESIEQLQTLVEKTPEVTIDGRRRDRADHGRAAGVHRVGAAGAARRVPQRPVGPDGDAAASSTRSARSRSDCPTSRDSEPSGVAQAFRPAGLYVSPVSRRRRHNRQETFASRASTRLTNIAFNNGERNRRPASYWLTVPLVALRSAAGS